ncbi:OLC1v1007250C1 [Oldenlandia corymbosa var. corymbosa]|uniref:OLC1v1007250C1 n=1 Tax=Oldenlandia corymbosa var. corymbosa TaxID=529605 RepID=A0AAV1DIW2_OLDCO|nr:OLC1v1007250C1 [Oldenlandia corymbosa var. corymbosa]
MAPKSLVMCLALVLVLMICINARAQSPCINTLRGLGPCLSYVNGTSSTPSPMCCSQLAVVVQSAPTCLCPFMTGTGPYAGVFINQTLALALPQTCNIQTPPASICNAVANDPATSPAPSPSVAPAVSPAVFPESPTPAAAASNPEPLTPTTSATTTSSPAITTPTLPGGASKTVPTSTNEGNLRKPAFFIFLVALASFLANF